MSVCLSGCRAGDENTRSVSTKIATNITTNKDVIHAFRLQHRIYGLRVSEAAGRVLTEGEQCYKPNQDCVSLCFIMIVINIIELTSYFLHIEACEKVCASCLFKLR